MKSKERLAKLLQISQNKLEILTLSEDLYIERDRFDPKKKKSRLVEEPKLPLKRVQKRIEELLKRIKIPDYIYASGKGRCYISNAKAHVNAAVVRSLDIKKYFPSTPSRRVYWFFHKQMKCSSDVAGILTKLSTFKNHLPTGSPLSPILSYFAHMDMWEAINEIVEGATCTLTVYMDDVTISGTQIPGGLIWQVEKQFHRCGLHDNREKEKHYVGNKPREITGVIVKEGELKLPNRQHLKMHQLRQLIHKETDPNKRVKLMQSLKGLEAQAQQIKKANDI
ncbi:reverse transcriptase family protein [Mastigocladopsis repens]|uniref:reverse transcriptase family protein n=1 Tax=Mastigocladopsis repens TaxID=221287 RepID=UPI001E4C2021|nr:reverse transcriptase family protein [Mastigocladopsis repens]